MLPLVNQGPLAACGSWLVEAEGRSETIGRDSVPYDADHRVSASTSQIRIVFSGSKLPLAILLPSGLTARATTGLSCPSSIATTFLLPTSHMTILPFSDPLTSQASAFSGWSTFMVPVVCVGLANMMAGQG